MCIRGDVEEINTLDGKSISVDACLQATVQSLNDDAVRTLACCCGHGVYPPTIVCIVNGVVFEFNSRTALREFYRSGRGRKMFVFYRTDEDGMMYLPEVCEWEDEPRQKRNTKCEKCDRKILPEDSEQSYCRDCIGAYPELDKDYWEDNI